MIIEGTVEGRRFSLDFSGDKLKANFEDKEDEKFFLEYEAYCYHPIEGPKAYAMKAGYISAQACIDDLIGAGVDITLTKGISEPYNGIVFE